VAGLNADTVHVDGIIKRKKFWEELITYLPVIGHGSYRKLKK
jgi:hypothetical protein